MRALAPLAILLAVACSDPSDTGGASSSGVVRSYETTVTRGSYDLRMHGGMVMGRVDGFLMDGQFLGPTLVADLGDTLEVTLVNETDVPVGLHPHGVRYDKANEGVTRLAEPGGSVTYSWEADQGTGTFLYHSHELDEQMREYQAEAGVLGVLVVLDPAEEIALGTDHMVNYAMTSTYEPWTTIDEDAMDTGAGGSDTGDTGGAGDASGHNHTMVVQEVRGDPPVTDTMESLTTTAALHDAVRVNVVAFGEEFHTFHMHGYTWQDPGAGRTLDTIGLGPAETYAFHLPDLDNAGLWMVHCHVDSHLHMMTTYLLVQ